ncbi:hypothetical protein CCR75_009332 [Bremia lactucae]|uniref:Uncharacterized protein n=1 Tax=Bremia lactucae TaxID=4779 RepID=A0A976FQ29_BRELC|nr:hypothetical protein CCR75_009738 [Bremia lactucae]TDH70776.1 hypothetical protein CCR75_009739 [Bremia lactucae]TDH70973.1 hypothetical protein CCR75_009332 [Bremia lactucae]
MFNKSAIVLCMASAALYGNSVDASAEVAETLGLLGLAAGLSGGVGVGVNVGYPYGGGYGYRPSVGYYPYNPYNPNYGYNVAPVGNSGNSYATASATASRNLRA